MKFGPASPADAIGGVTVHTLRQGPLVLKKGTTIGPAEVEALTRAGVKQIVVVRLEDGDVSEDYRPNHGTAGLDVDEFPFATTYEGAAQHTYDPTAPADNFSAKMIDSAENQAGGSQLGVYYGYNRVIDGSDDGFYVEITS